MGPVKQMALIFALCQLHNYCLGDADQEGLLELPADPHSKLFFIFDWQRDELSIFFQRYLFKKFSTVHIDWRTCESVGLECENVIF
jgi:hypothetical protein